MIYIYICTYKNGYLRCTCELLWIQFVELLQLPKDSIRWLCAGIGRHVASISSGFSRALGRAPSQKPLCYRDQRDRRYFYTYLEDYLSCLSFLGYRSYLSSSMWDRTNASLVLPQILLPEFQWFASQEAARHLPAVADLAPTQYHIVSWYTMILHDQSNASLRCLWNHWRLAASAVSQSRIRWPGL